mgnify:CR=1 FL=1
MCDGSSPGSPYPDGEYASPNGTDDMAVRLASCWATATATGNCCDGAITTWQVTGIYDYSKCVGNQCPGG